MRKDWIRRKDLGREHACIFDHYNPGLAHERHYATFSFDTQFLNAALLTESPARLRWRFLFLFVSYLSLFLLYCSLHREPLSFVACTCICVCICERVCVLSCSHTQLLGTRHRKLLKNRGALTHVVCDSFTRSHPRGRTCDIFQVKKKISKQCSFLDRK